MKNENFAQWLSRKLDSKDWSMRRLANESGISHATISLVMGCKQAPTPNFCLSIAEPLGVSGQEVLWRAGLGEKPVTADEPYLLEIIESVRLLPEKKRKELLVLVGMLKSDTLVVQGEDSIEDHNSRLRRARATIHLEAE